ncbi:glyceraldehyde-3-phosphate dehydrogenase [Larsenimonas rhizosphaerae]|uniref:Glyceraldehyde-3-phosphate dehydrogenase n=1 Tax=Larsenimonas rhizosphaerae TaxID=2944682 RepID=A0AA42CXB7_9GAMM|nr:glyceraldehyde-3-phosphate dehydrogenase [Larsenimonas rhizosphaerae]MCX2523700.1 glyceraldehyde-3-phosphate dehydrogenase [Larsenimonas rhizosphaerae]
MSRGPDDQCFQVWQSNEALAEEMIPLLGRLYREYQVIPVIYGRPLAHQSVIRILKDHRFVRKVEGTELTVRDTFPLVKRLLELAPGPAEIDLGKLAVRFKREGASDPLAFLKQQLAPVVGRHDAEARKVQSPQDVVLYGFGRIGRLLARIIIETGDASQMRLRAIVVRGAGGDLEKRASLLRRDSVHGPFQGTIALDEDSNALIVNGHRVQVIYADSPSSIDYTDYGINDAIVVDNTGKWRDRDGLAQHLEARGVAKVLLTAPGKGDLKNIVMGINDDSVTDGDDIISAASCTTNAITPVLKVLNDRFGIEHGHVETVHSYTNDQNLIDNFHKAERRGRSAALNMVITETGAAKAVVKALPELDGKLTGNAIRVPTPNVSLAILNLTLASETDRAELNDYLRDISIHSSLGHQIDYVCSPEVVSSDFVGNRHAGIVDGEATIAEGRQIVLYVWYDNEYGYSCQVTRLVQRMACQKLIELPA